MLDQRSRAVKGDERHASAWRWLPGAAAAGAATIVGAVAALAIGTFDAKGDATPTAQVPSAGVGDVGEQEATLKQLHEWLTSQGADLGKVKIMKSQAGPGAGLGIFSAVAAAAPRPGAPWWSWLWPHRNHTSGAQREPTTLASFPLDAAITVRTACNDPQVGAQFSWMLDKHLLDERTAVMVYLLIERLRGDKSRFAPWIRALPTTFDVPIAFTAQELAELRGTALHRATAAVVRRLEETWSRLEGPLNAVARELGLPAPGWKDWLWAYCVFWSRGQSLPVPESGSASSALVGHSSKGSDKIPIQILEGLVPGLDFCNHRLGPPPQCWWEVVAPERPKGSPAAGPGSPASASCSASSPSSLQASSARSHSLGAPDSASLGATLHGGAHVRPGEELYISYGEKSNEELLMLYGFALEDNPHDHLMLYCPLPPRAEWDDVMYARMELLQAYGLRPQFFLPHPDLVLAASSGSAVGSHKGKASDRKRAGGSAAALVSASFPAAAAAAATRFTATDAADSDAGGASKPPLELPPEVLDTLEVFVLNFQELAVRSNALQAKMEERRAARAAGTPLAAMSQHSPVLELASLRSRYERMSTAELRHYLQALGLRMATLTTFIRLLEIKATELEGSEGTGPLEEDERLLQTLAQPTAPSATGGAAGAAAGTASATAAAQQQEAEQRERRLRAALVYRVGQKRLARAWLVRAKGELQNMLALMRDMQFRQDVLERGATQQ
ncbi:hypothetical protein VOLCADRAFT_91853 [Volvox carteri f. nagariensis]|uniref:SET domain-containing protein n=1 Tax=Volvox carteri f. nagariensis TaxID=3068 RepID=D8TY46_VOLCA|nr:uncharacterized protein VOLCADRAFT_91853 [Volvox carteri f. nagariensis]EFJ47486.1 hypothetical protein VOLCADRAFT_91853 [Volvox carteri f. nagariensis]|eukprot:XP_002951310.1 hypothetical protein VOLCADRAFT_91853 [Volvox carteri f. nagariensis]